MSPLQISNILNRNVAFMVKIHLACDPLGMRKMKEWKHLKFRGGINPNLCDNDFFHGFMSSRTPGGGNIHPMFFSRILILPLTKKAQKVDVSLPVVLVRAVLHKKVRHRSVTVEAVRVKPP